MTSTDLVRYEPRQTSMEIAPDAWKLAEKIADTDFVPKSLRGRREAVLACILAGHEAGVPPMASLAKIHIVDGRPGMAAELMRALVVQHGHDIWFENISNTAATLGGKRRDSTRETRTTWTIDDARNAGLLNKDNWKKYPRAMLVARATAELCRMIFPDVLAGLSYTVEELTDGDLVSALTGPPEETTAPPRTTRARAAKAITRPGQTEDATPVKPPPPPGDVPTLPGDEMPIEDAEIIDDVTSAPSGSAPLNDEPKTGNAGTPATDEDWPEGDWPDGDWPADAPPIDQRRYTGPQLIAIKIYELFGIGRGGGDKARRERLDAIAVLVGHPVTSSKDLPPEETASLLATLDAWPEGEPFPWPDSTTTAPGTSPATGEGSTPPATGETEPEATPEPSLAPPPPAPDPPTPKRTRPNIPPPEDWDGDRWRETLAARKVKVTEAMKEAQRLGAAADPARSIGTLDDVAGSGIAADLLGYVEDLSLERKAAAK